MPQPDAATLPAFVSWDVFLRDHFRWLQGEHVSVVGPTGTGKSTLVLAILHLRTYIVVLGTKPRDKLLSRLARASSPAKRSLLQKIRREPADGYGFKLARDWPAGPPSLFPRVLLWPKQLGIDDEYGAREIFVRAIRQMYQEGRWCIYFDEAADFSEDMGLESYLKTLWRKGRSLGLSIVAATQRPRGVPVMMWGQATHLFFFQTSDDDDLRRVGGIGGMDGATIRACVKALGGHEVLYVNARDKTMIRTQVAA